MGISYNPAARQWNIVPERTDYNTTRPITSNVTIGLYPKVIPSKGTYISQEIKALEDLVKPTNLTIMLHPKDGVMWKDAGQLAEGIIRNNIAQANLPSSVTSSAISNSFLGANKTKEPLTGSVEWTWGPAYVNDFQLVDKRPGTATFEQLKQSALASFAKSIDDFTRNQELNGLEAYDKAVNETKNSVYSVVQSIIDNTRGGDYVKRREEIRNLVNSPLYENIPEIKTLGQNIENNFRSFYSTEKINQWDVRLGAREFDSDGYKEFNPDYYKEANPQLSQEWNNAVHNDDLDITQRYVNENAFLLQHYTNVGKPAGQRGNRAETTTASERYIEAKPTDADIQEVRKLQLGIDSESQSDRLLRIPEVSREWEKAKNGDPYWKQLAKENYLNVNKKDDFTALFRLSSRPEDQQIRFNYNANTGYGITELEDALNEAVGEKAAVEVKKFGALAQNVLKDTIDEMRKAKIKEQQLGLYKGIGTFSEIFNVNKELANSILGDSGVGGVLAFTSGGKAEETLEKQLQKVTGVNNNVTYNWQQWFDTQLKTKYNQAIELGMSDGEAKEQVEVEATFARNFIDKYLIPRFNASRSMDEFVEYMDVRQEEKNPFQTQDLMDAAKLVANLKANQYLNQLRNSPDRFFDANFYFNPTGNKAREAKYAEQANTINSDWEAAKRGDSYWAQQAYRFGIDVNDKAAFARLHFQVKGQAKGFDPAEDVLNAGKISDYIYTEILPALKTEVEKTGSIFGQFILPEEFADEVLQGLDPNDKTTWQEVLKKYGLEDFKGTLEELKEYIVETLRTGTAQEIREQIKYLNEKKQKPTQEVLGVTYIERPEDYSQGAPKADTELYKIFQSAGFQGTEDEFYENFFPDIDRSEQIALTKAGKNEALKTTGLKFGDPFESLTNIESFFETDDEQIKDKEEEDSTTKPSYFKIDTDEELPEKSKSGKGFLEEFTSMFKGFS